MTNQLDKEDLSIEELTRFGLGIYKRLDSIVDSDQVYPSSKSCEIRESERTSTRRFKIFNN